MKLICGLGNPGEKYARTRHNAGFLFLDRFAEENDFPKFTLKGKSLLSEKGEGHKKVILIKPQTLMNLSGEAVREAMQFYKIDPADLLVVYDDVDLPLGTIRFREKGSAGTHNGMKSIIENIATLDFPRLRLGVESRGVHAPEQMPLDVFVLSPFLSEEEAIFQKEMEEAEEKLKKEGFALA